MTATTNSPLNVKPGPQLAAGFSFIHLLENLGSTSKFNLRSCTLAFGDFCAIIVSLGLGWVAAGIFRHFTVAERKSFIAITSVDLGYIALIVLITTGVLLISNLSEGHYSRGKLFWSQVTEAIQAVAYAVAMTTVALFATKEDFSRPWLVSFWLLVILILPIFRLLSTKYLINKGIWFRNAVVIGDGENARSAAAALESDKYLGFKVVGFIRKTHTAIAGQNYEMRRVASQHLTGHPGEIEFVVFAFDTADEFTIHRNEIEDLMAKSSSVVLAPPLAGLPMHEAEVLSVFKHDAVLLRLHNNLKKPWSLVLKRAFDLITCGIVTLLISPLLIIITLLVARNGGNPIFAHTRIGKNGKSFSCYKFRTMVPDADEKLAQLLLTNPELKLEWDTTFKLKNDVRVTPIGRFLRSTSLDELPQLWNVVKGDMSLVGPRPIVKEEIARYGDDFVYFSSTKPGITGLWQISGRSDLGYAERIRLDKWYIRNWSVWQDVVILLKSIPIVLSKRGAY